MVQVGRRTHFQRVSRSSALLAGNIRNMVLKWKLTFKEADFKDAISVLTWMVH